MKHYLFVGVSCLVIGGFASVYALPSKIEYKNVEIQTAPPSETEIVAKRASDILQSKVFQDEMKTVATARALYQLSIEQGDKAKDLSEMAVLTNAKSQIMADAFMASSSKKK